MSDDRTIVHPAPVRIFHWLNVFAMLAMVTSGWQIYNASPLFDFRFPGGITLGGWLAGALRWHFAAMWLLVANGLAYLAYGLVSGHLRSLTVSVAALRPALGAALRGRLEHRVGNYNPLQRAAYLAALGIGAILVLSGLAIWKPVQLQELTALFGGYDAARFWHFYAMVALLLFAAGHLAMVALVPSTLYAMLTGAAWRGRGNS